MTNKEIKFSMKFDTGDFDRAVEKMQQKLKEIAGLGKGASSPGGGGPGAPGGPAGSGGSVGGGGAGDPMMTKPGMEAFYKSMQALRSSAHSAMAQHGKDHEGYCQGRRASRKAPSRSRKNLEKQNKRSSRRIANQKRFEIYRRANLATHQSGWSQ